MPVDAPQCFSKPEHTIQMEKPYSMHSDATSFSRIPWRKVAPAPPWGELR